MYRVFSIFLVENGCTDLCTSNRLNVAKAIRQLSCPFLFQEKDNGHVLVLEWWSVITVIEAMVSVNCEKDAGLCVYGWLGGFSAIVSASLIYMGRLSGSMRILFLVRRRYRNSKSTASLCIFYRLYYPYTFQPVQVVHLVLPPFCPFIP